MLPSSQPLNPRPRPGPFLLWGLVVILAAAFIACGPADQPVQERLGNVPQVAQDDPATPTPEPTPIPEPTPEPTVEPAPTRCITASGEDGQPVELCGPDSTAVPPKYPNLLYIDTEVEELEKALERVRESDSGTAVQIEVESYTVYVLTNDEPNARENIKAWLEERSLVAEDFQEKDLKVGVPVTLLGPLSQLPGVFVVTPVGGNIQELHTDFSNLPPEPEPLLDFSIHDGSESD